MKMQTAQTIKAIHLSLARTSEITGRVLEREEPVVERCPCGAASHGVDWHSFDIEVG